MTLSEFIEQLQLLLIQHGDLQVWVKDGVPPSPKAIVIEAFSPNDAPDKVVFIE